MSFVRAKKPTGDQLSFKFLVMIAVHSLADKFDWLGFCGLAEKDSFFLNFLLSYDLPSDELVLRQAIFYTLKTFLTKFADLCNLWLRLGEYKHQKQKKVIYFSEGLVHCFRWWRAFRDDIVLHPILEALSAPTFNLIWGEYTPDWNSSLCVPALQK